MPATKSAKPSSKSPPKSPPPPPPTSPAPYHPHKRDKVTLIKLVDVIDDEENHRIPTKADKVKIDELTGSIRVTGVLVPIEVYRDVNGKLRKVDGYRRCEAASAAGLVEIPAYVLSYIPSPDEREARRAIYNIHREQLNAAEESIAVVRVVEGKKGDVAAAAAELGKSETWVRDRLYLQKLTPKVRDLLVSGNVNLGQALELVKLADPKTQEAFAHQITDDVKQGMVTSIDDLRQNIADLDHPLNGVPWSLEVPFAGKPACNVCPYNQANDITLFGITKASAATDPCCTLDSCYSLKVATAGAMQKDAADKVKDAVKKNLIQAKDAGSIHVARDFTPAGINVEAVQSFLKSTVAAPAAAKAKSAGGKPKPLALDRQPTAKAPTEKQLRQKAVTEWGNAYNDWRGKLEQALAKMTATDPRLNLVAYWLDKSQSKMKHPHFAITNGDANPPEEKAVSPVLSKLLDAAEEETFDAESLAADMTVYSSVRLWGVGPELAKRIAGIFGLDMNDPKASPPELEDFLPEDLWTKKSSAISANSPGRPRDAKGNLLVEKGQQVAPPGQKDFCQPGCYVVITATKAVGESQGYSPGNRNTVNVQIASGAIRPHFAAELRAATAAEAQAFENARTE